MVASSRSRLDRTPKTRWAAANVTLSRDVARSVAALGAKRADQSEIVNNMPTRIATLFDPESSHTGFKRQQCQVADVETSMVKAVGSLQVNTSPSCLPPLRPVRRALR